MAKSKETAISTAINGHRDGIQAIDRQIFELLGNRMKLALQIGGLKKETGIPVIDAEREEKLRKDYVSYGRKHGLSQEFVERLLEVILDESKRIQSK